MRLRLTLLLAALATVALGAAPTMAAAKIVTLSAGGKTLKPGAEIRSSSTNTVFTHSGGYGKSQCPLIEFDFELIQNGQETAELQQLGYAQVPKVCEHFDTEFVGKDIRIVKDSFQVGVGNGNEISLLPEKIPGTENAYVADLGKFQFEYEVHWTVSSPGVFQGPCGTTGGGTGAWSSSPSIDFSILAYIYSLEFLWGPCSGSMGMEGHTAGGSLTDVSTGKPVKITIS